MQRIQPHVSALTMQRVALKIHGGGTLEVHGSLEKRPVVVLLSRENFHLDDALIARLMAHFANRGIATVRYASEKEETTRLIDRARFAGLPPLLRGALKSLQLLRYPSRWMHFSPRYRATRDEITYRADSIVSWWNSWAGGGRLFCSADRRARASQRRSPTGRVWIK